MGLVVDTSVFVRAERAGVALPTLLPRLGDEAVAIAAITASELLHGVHRADTAVRRATRGARVEELLAHVPVVPFDLAIARVHSRIWADLAARGAGVGPHDLLIAATALCRGDGVLTANVREFGRIEGLRVEVLPPHEGHGSG